MNDFKIIKLDCFDSIHISFTWDVLLERYKKQNINLTDNKIPTFNEHKANLARKSYKFYYIIQYKDIMYGIIFLNQDLTIGIYTLSKSLKNIIKLYKSDLRDLKTSIINPCFDQIIELHKSSIPYIISKINTNNVYSINLAKQLGSIELYKTETMVVLKRTT